MFVSVYVALKDACNEHFINAINVLAGDLRRPEGV